MKKSSIPNSACEGLIVVHYKPGTVFIKILAFLVQKKPGGVVGVDKGRVITLHPLRCGFLV